MQVIYSGDPNMSGQPTVVYVQAQGQSMGMQPMGMQPMGMQPMGMQPMGMQPIISQPVMMAQPVYQAPQYITSTGMAARPGDEGRKKAANIMANGLFSCFDDCESCLYATLCPCCAVGTNVERTGQGSCALWGFLYLVGLYFQCPCVCGMISREKVQQAARVPVTPVENCLLHTFCICCAIAQEGRATKALRDASTAPSRQRMA